MQNLIMYAVADSTLGTIRDYSNARNVAAPIFTRGFSATIKLRLFSEMETQDAYPISSFVNVSSFQCVWDTDYSSATTPVIVADNSDIYAHSVTEVINGTSYTFTEVVIPITNMNTEQLVALIGNRESVSGINMELVGFDSEASEVFGLQIKGFSARNRIYYGGTPTVIQPDYLTASQVRALIAAGMALQYSVDGSTLWHDTQVAADRYFRMRSASDAQAIWSGAIALIVGPQGPAGTNGTNGTNGVDGQDGEDGADGQSAYVYVRYASDNSGTDFSATPSATRKYIAVKQTTEPIATPAASDFVGLWVKFIGDDGQTSSASWGDITGALSNQTDLNIALSEKQNVLVAGYNVSFNGNTISATDTTYSAGNNVTIIGGTVSSSMNWGGIGGTLANQTDLQEALEEKQDTLTAGDNITITGKTISATASGASPLTQVINLGYVISDFTSNIAPGNVYTVTSMGGYTWYVQLTGTTAGYYGTAEIFLTAGQYTPTIASSSTVTVVDTLEANKVNHLHVEFNGTTARIYKVDAY